MIIKNLKINLKKLFYNTCKFLNKITSKLLEEHEKDLKLKHLYLKYVKMEIYPQSNIQLNIIT